MFERLIESDGTVASSRGRKSLLAITSLSVITLFAGGMLGSLFNSALAMDGELGDLERLATPVLAAAKPEPERPVEKKTISTPKVKNVLPTRKQFIQRTEDAPARPPKSVSSIPSALKTRPIGDFVISDRDFDPPKSGLSSQSNETGVGFADTKTGTGSGIGEVVEEIPKPTVPKPPELKKVPEAPAYVGVVNGKAIFLDMPGYPDTARQMGLKGMVKVQVLIDEEGNVVSANAVDGHPLLRGTSVQAARRSKFSPTFLNRKKIKVRGIIVYNFK